MKVISPLVLEPKFKTNDIPSREGWPSLFEVQSISQYISKRPQCMAMKFLEYERIISYVYIYFSIEYYLETRMHMKDFLIFSIFEKKRKLLNGIHLLKSLVNKSSSYCNVTSSLYMSATLYQCDLSNMIVFLLQNINRYLSKTPLRISHISCSCSTR